MTSKVGVGSSGRRGDLKLSSKLECDNEESKLCLFLSPAIDFDKGGEDDTSNRFSREFEEFICDLSPEESKRAL